MIHDPIPSVNLLTSEMLSPNVEFEGFDADLSYTTGQRVKLMKVHVTTINRIPYKTYLVVDVPRHFIIDSSDFAVTISSGSNQRTELKCSCPFIRSALDVCFISIALYGSPHGAPT